MADPLAAHVCGIPGEAGSCGQPATWTLVSSEPRPGGMFLARTSLDCPTHGQLGTDEVTVTAETLGAIPPAS